MLKRERESGGPQGGCHFGQRFLFWEFPKTDKKILYHQKTVASDTRCQVKSLFVYMENFYFAVSLWAFFRRKIKNIFFFSLCNLHRILSRSVVKSNTGALWCYKNNINRSDLYICLWFRKQNLAK